MCQLCCYKILVISQDICSDGKLLQMLPQHSPVKPCRLTDYSKWPATGTISLLRVFCIRSCCLHQWSFSCLMLEKDKVMLLHFSDTNYVHSKPAGQTSLAPRISPKQGSTYGCWPAWMQITALRVGLSEGWDLKNPQHNLFGVTANSPNGKTVSNKRNVTKWSEFLTTPVSDCIYSDKSTFHYPIQMTHPRKWLISESLSFLEATLTHLFVQESSFCKWRPSMLKTSFSLTSLWALVKETASS